MPKNKHSQQVVTIYTDGACDPNPGRGGWGALLIFPDKEKVIEGSAPYTTNNRMELTAAIKALRLIPNDLRVKLYTDSQYLKRGIEEWMAVWIARNWRRKGGKLANVDLWKKLADENNRLDIEWRWVQGHRGNPYNERVNKIAQKAIYNNKYT